MSVQTAGRVLIPDEHLALLLALALETIRYEGNIAAFGGGGGP